MRYVLRPPLAKERLGLRPDGLVRIVLERAFGDGTSAVDTDPLSLLCRLAPSVPLPRFHAVKYAGVLAPASSWRSRVVLPRAPADTAETPESPPKAPKRTGTYRPRAGLRRRTFGIDVLGCPKRAGPMKLVAGITDRTSAARSLRSVPSRIGRVPS